MSYNRYSSSIVWLVDATVLYCENTPDDIKEQMSRGDTVILDLSDENMEIPVSKADIASYTWSD